MIFSSLYFLFVFLPLSLILYYVTPKRFRNVTLCVISLLFYAWGNPAYLVLMLFSVVFNYITGIEIHHFRENDQPVAAKVTMIIAVVINLLMLCFFKYVGGIIEAINGWTGLHIWAPNLALPLGISFYTFTVLSYVLDVYWEKTPVQKNFIHYTTYVTFFPKLLSGPIVSYRDMEEQLTERQMNPAKFGRGLNMFLVGVFKKVLISDNLGTAFNAIFALETMSAGTAWLGALLYFFQLYFDFSSYSDMAIGLGRMFGFQFDKNFDHPYLSTGVSEFWRRWHISLGAWFRNYVYIPLGGNRKGRNRAILNNFIIFVLTGIWHGSTLNFLFWGIYHGIFVILEKFVLEKQLEKLPKLLRWFLTMLIVYFGWVLFFCPSLSSALHYFGQMFGMGGMGFLDATAKYYLSGNLILLIIAAIGSGSLVQRLHQKIAYWKGGWATYVSVALYVLLILLTVAYLVSSTYTSFLYFQF